MFTFGDTVDDQQLGCLWQGDYLLTVSLSGNINYLDTNNPSSPMRIIKVVNVMMMMLLIIIIIIIIITIIMIIISWG